MDIFDQDEIQERNIDNNLVWMDMIRGLGIIGVVIHHWILFFPHKSSSSFPYELAELIKDFGGTAVHLFIVLSGVGLTISYFRSDGFGWRAWAKRRFWKIVVPYWIIVTLTFIMANLASFVFPVAQNHGYSWSVLLAYVLFTRNVNRSSWDLNPTLWFMPVILGLYILFPMLIKVVKRLGIRFLLALSFLLTYGSITFCEVLDFTVSHQTAWPFFYIIEFALGMAIGYVMCFNPGRFLGLRTFNVLFSGMVLYLFSAIMIRFWSFGSAYNDVLTCGGIFLMALCVCQWVVQFAPQKCVRLLGQVGKVSYIMYLIHGPIILFVVKPFLQTHEILPLNSSLTILLSIFFCTIIFWLSCLISPITNSFIIRMRGPLTARGEVS